MSRVIAAAVFVVLVALDVVLIASGAVLVGVVLLAMLAGPAYLALRHEATKS